MKVTDLNHQTRELQWGRAQRSILAALLIGSLGLVGACSDDEDTGADIGEECQTSGDCKSSLVCRETKCVEPKDSNGPDAGGQDPGDTSQPDTTAPDTSEPSEPVDEEDFYISYIHRHELDQTRELHVLYTGDGTDTQITGEDHPCEKNCWLSYDLKTFIWVTGNPDVNGTSDVWAADVNDLQVQDGETLLASAVQNIKPLPDGVTYSKITDQGFAAYHVDFAGNETQIGDLGSPDAVPSGWFVSPEHDLSMIFKPTLVSLALALGKADGSNLQTKYTLNADSYSAASSFYSASMPVAISRDGKTLAMINTAPNYYGECSTSADCEGPVQYCTGEMRCARIELTVQFLDVDNLDKLGGQCSDDADCGAAHMCDFGDVAVNEGTCIPGRTVLGLPDMPFQKPIDTESPKSGCDLTEGLDDYRYNKLASSMSFDEQGRFYAVAQRNCSSENRVGSSEIIQIDPSVRDINVVWGSSEMGYDADNCWDDLNGRPDDQRCEPYLANALLSPEANQFAVNATNPNIDSDDLAVKFQDIWRVQRNGKGQKWIGNHSIFSITESLMVHPEP